MFVLLFIVTHLNCPLVPLLTCLLAQLMNQLADLQVLLGFAVPFGRPGVTNPAVVRSIVKHGYPPAGAAAARVPGWRPTWPATSKNELSFRVEERVDAVQYDNRKTPDAWTVSGAVHAAVDVEGVPEVGVTVACADDSIGRISLHNCTQLGTEALTAGGLRVQFVPPPCAFVLGTYSVRTPAQVPVRGALQLAEEADGRVRFLLQLRLDAAASNSFEHFEAVLPFFNRGVVSSVQANPSQGTVAVGSDRASLVWTVGARIASARLEASLAGVVAFEATYGATAAALEHSKDPFCTGLTAYAKLHFRINNWTPGACVVDPRKVTLSPAPRTRPTISVTRCCVSGDYTIWNSNGKARHCVPIEFEPSFS